MTGKVKKSRPFVAEQPPAYRVDNVVPVLWPLVYGVVVQRQQAQRGRRLQRSQAVPVSNKVVVEVEKGEEGECLPGLLSRDASDAVEGKVLGGAGEIQESEWD